MERSHGKNNPLYLYPLLTISNRCLEGHGRDSRMLANNGEIVEIKLLEQEGGSAVESPESPPEDLVPVSRTHMAV